MYFVNVEAAIRRDGHWLIIERSKKEEHAGGLLSLVGGTVEGSGPSENSLEDTLIREVFEEIGVRIKNQMTYVRSSSFPLEDGRMVLDLVFLCEIEDGEPYIKSKDEVEAFFWMTKDEIKSHPQAPSWLIASVEVAEKKVAGK